MFNQEFPFPLKKLPPDIDFRDPDLLELVIQARSELAELKGYSSSIPNQLLLLSPAILKESLASSEIEDIHTTILDVLENQLFPEEERKQPDKEVLRYHEGIMWGYENLKSLGISTRTIVGIQSKLLPDKPTGYRQQQNGIEDKKTKEILYIPPVQADVPRLMGELENFLNNDANTKIDPLLSCVISHYQFEAIHPFSDGNGRTGRILMVLYLVQREILTLPILYISGYINQNKNEYYRLLLGVTTRGEWKEYIIFMLNGFCQQAKLTKEIVAKIRGLYFNLKDDLKKNHRNIYNADLVESLFTYPIISPVRLGTEMGVHYTTASRYLKSLEKAGILVSRRVGTFHLFAYKDLLDILH